MIELGRGSRARTRRGPRSGSLFRSPDRLVARRHRSPLCLLYRTNACPKAWLVWGWRTICVFLGFAARVQGCVVGFVGGLVLDFGCNEGMFDALFGGGFGVGLGVANDKGGLVLGHGFLAIGNDVVEPAEV